MWPNLLDWQPLVLDLPSVSSDDWRDLYIETLSFKGCNISVLCFDHVLLRRVCEEMVQWESDPTELAG